MTPFLIAVGVAGILTLAELCRRCVGVPILVVVGALLVYTFVSMLKGGQTFDQVLGRVIYTLRRAEHARAGVCEVYRGVHHLRRISGAHRHLQLLH